MDQNRNQFAPNAVAGHPLATAIGADILSGGGNAVDAGVAMGLALSVLESIQVQFSGTAPILIRDGSTGRIVSIAGLGPWPGKTDPTAFRKGSRALIPQGVLRTVVPAAPDAWITALRAYGTLSFAELAEPAIRLAREGFPAHPGLAALSERHARYLRRNSENARIWLPGGEAIRAGQQFLQRDLAGTLQFLADEDRAARTLGGREAGLMAARDAFYTGDIGQAIVQHNQAEGGWLDHADMAAYRSPVEDAVATEILGQTLFTCGPWCQGPVVPMALKILEGYDLAGLAHNSAPYLHLVTEAIKLAYADREKYIGDPATLAVPLDRLLSAGHATSRRALIDRERAWPGMPPPGEIPGHGGALPIPPAAWPDGPALDTSVCCAADSRGNVFVATPSDMALDAPAVPGLGLVVSTRGSQSYAMPGHAAAVAPGSRPRLTASPLMAVTASGAVLAAGGPGGDAQPQAMTQMLLNHWVFGLNLQESVNLPRVASISFPTSREPHVYFAGALEVEAAVPPEVQHALEELGHEVVPVDVGNPEGHAICALIADPASGRTVTAADPRLGPTGTSAGAAT